MSVCVVLVDVVRVVGEQQRGVDLFRQSQQVGANLAFDGHAVVHELAEVVILAEDLLVGTSRLDGLVELPQPQSGLDLT